MSDQMDFLAQVGRQQLLSALQMKNEGQQAFGSAPPTQQPSTMQPMFCPPVQPPPNAPMQYMNWTRPGPSANPNCFTCQCHKNLCQCGRYINGQWSGHRNRPQPPPAAQPAPQDKPATAADIQSLIEATRATSVAEPKHAIATSNSATASASEDPPAWASLLLTQQKELMESQKADSARISRLRIQFPI